MNTEKLIQNATSIDKENTRLELDELKAMILSLKEELKASTDCELRKGRAQERNHCRKSNRSLTGRVSSKLADGDVRGAVRLLSSIDRLAKDNDETLRTLRSKRPSDGGRQYFEESSSFDTISDFLSYKSEIPKAIELLFRASLCASRKREMIFVPLKLEQLFAAEQQKFEIEKSQKTIDTEGKANEISSAQNDKNEMTDQQRKDYDHHKLEAELPNKNVPLKEDDRKKTTVADETAKITAEDIRLKRKQRTLDDFRNEDEEYEEFSKLFNKIKKLERIAKEDLNDSEAFPKLLTNFSPNLLSTSDHASLTECTAFSRNDIEERNEHRKSPEDRCGNGAGKTEVKFSKYLDGNRSQKKKNQVIDLEPQDTKEYVERGEKLKESRKMETMSNMKTQTEKAKSKKIAEVLKNLTKIQDARFKDVPSGHSTVSQHGGAQNEERALSKLPKEYLIYLSKKEKSEMTDQERSDYYQFKREHKARKEKKRLLMETMMKLRSASEKAEKYNPKRNRKTESKMKIQSKRRKLDTLNEDSIHFSKNELCGYQLERSEHERSSKYCCSANEKEDEEIFSEYLDANSLQKDKQSGRF
ncbi:hypothetical protein ACOME3_007981 [Neoechinorhynchus agilis]